VARLFIMPYKSRPAVRHHGFITHLQIIPVWIFRIHCDEQLHIHSHISHLIRRHRETLSVLPNISERIRFCMYRRKRLIFPEIYFLHCNCGLSLSLSHYMIIVPSVHYKVQSSSYSEWLLLYVGIFNNPIFIFPLHHHLTPAATNPSHRPPKFNPMVFIQHLLTSVYY
jgi:hypothetical protein